MKKTSPAGCVSIFRNDDGELFLSPGKGRFLLHPDDCVDNYTEVHVFGSRREAEAFCLGVEAAIGVIPDVTPEVVTVVRKCKDGWGAIFEVIGEIHNERCVPVTLH